ncbi:hypothetical protein SARC_07625 [Sphaeroforma arctica JP610]|uniref:Uncharacterized protein n=1 Tax=Sphaeroforma arctica JP610 TaxID=667725 RepID=A0A0L0FVM6_9EUKA|nr:hypothetical protein SARC_07625 [Sphaeroforma arctica JP610]KNC79993.1 hypothetical protein SARC_07625 [Sphaeroforma arctica JP610]|eukprot:XP_014153895.1 hypothetical protein SARC_07625 [Sphaeroforma arctica JP610]
MYTPPQHVLYTSDGPFGFIGSLLAEMLALVTELGMQLNSERAALMFGCLLTCFLNIVLMAAVVVAVNDAEAEMLKPHYSLYSHPLHVMPPVAPVGHSLCDQPVELLVVSDIVPQIHSAGQIRVQKGTAVSVDSADHLRVPVVVSLSFNALSWCLCTLTL